MKLQLSAFVFAVLALVAFNSAQASEFSVRSCARYVQNETYAKALNTVATNMKYTTEQMCAQDYLSDVYLVNHIVYTTDGKEIPHVWVTLHYPEHSCQYFVRNADLVVTAKNCYNTW